MLVEAQQVCSRKIIMSDRWRDYVGSRAEIKKKVKSGIPIALPLGNIECMVVFWSCSEEAVAGTEMLQVDVCGVVQLCVAWPPLPAKVTAAAVATAPAWKAKLLLTLTFTFELLASAKTAWDVDDVNWDSKEPTKAETADSSASVFRTSSRKLLDAILLTGPCHSIYY